MNRGRNQFRRGRFRTSDYSRSGREWCGRSHGRDLSFGLQTHQTRRPMNAFDQPIKTLIISSEVLDEPAELDPNYDWIFDASTRTIDESFVHSYQRFLNALEIEKHSRVLVTQAEYLSLFPNDCIVVPTLGEAEDLIEMERIERDLLGF